MTEHEHRARDHHGHEHHGHEPLDYVDAVEGFRADKDEFFRTATGSPLPVEDREGFTGLPYYRVDPSLRFEGLRLEPYTGDEPLRFEIPTSDGRLRARESFARGDSQGQLVQLRSEHGRALRSAP